MKSKTRECFKEDSMAFYPKACPRCEQGQVFLVNGIYGREEDCLQCGYVGYPEFFGARRGKGRPRKLIHINGIPFKECIRCHQVKPATTDFFPLRQNGLWRYLRSWCRECDQEYGRNYHKTYQHKNRNLAMVGV